VWIGIEVKNEREKETEAILGLSIRKTEKNCCVTSNEEIYV